MGRFVQSLKEEKRLIGVAALILTVSALAGYFSADALEKVLRQAGVWEQLEKAVRAIREEPTFLNGFAVIFFNNLRAAVTMMGLGIFFGVFPVMALVSNGLMMGVVLGKASAETGTHPLIMFATSILPHGILELPAVIFAAAYGIRLGITFSKWVLSLAAPQLRSRSREEWKGLMERIPYAVTGIIVLLVLAALIESALILLLTHPFPGGI